MNKNDMKESLELIMGSYERLAENNIQAIEDLTKGMEDGVFKNKIESKYSYAAAQVTACKNILQTHYDRFCK